MSTVALEQAPTVFVVDDDPYLREAAQKLIRSIGLEVETYASAEEYLGCFDGARPGCLLLDVRLRGMSGLELLERLSQERAQIPIIVLTGFGDVPMAVRALKLGAVEFVQKPYNPQDLLERIRKAVAHDLRERQQRAELDEVKDRLSSLTARERQVMDLVVSGCSNKEIAARLGLSQKTVETHRIHIMQKARANNAVELTRMAIAAGHSQHAQYIS
jgi:two-component system response regulator FixJ